jgi:hypothetical protein
MNEERLWPGAAPGFDNVGQVEKIADSKADPRFRMRSITGVTVPTITIFPAPQELTNGIAVIEIGRAHV